MDALSPAELIDNLLEPSHWFCSLTANQFLTLFDTGSIGKTIEVQNDDNEEDNFRIMDTKGFAYMPTSTTKTMTALLGAVAAVSLLVGGLGIIKIMLVSVTERAWEIGIILALATSLAPQKCWRFPLPLISPSSILQFSSLRLWVWCSGISRP